MTELNTDEHNISAYNTPLQILYVNTTGILNDKRVLNSFGQINNTLFQDFLAEGYNPIYAELAQLSKIQPNATKANSREIEALISKTESLVDQLTKDRSDLLNTNEDQLSLDSETSNQITIRSLRFIKHNLNEGHSASQIAEALNKRLIGQTVKDLLNRTPMKVYDQNNKIVKFNGKEDFAVYLREKTKETQKLSSKNETECFIEVLKDELNLQPEQLNVILTRFNQRNITGVGAAISSQSQDPDRAENRFIVGINDQNKITGLLAIETIGVTKRPLYSTEPGLEEVMIEDAEGNPIYINASKTTYHLDMKSLNGESSSLNNHIQKEPNNEYIIYEAFTNEDVYKLSDILKSRAIDINSKYIKDLVVKELKNSQDKQTSENNSDVDKKIIDSYLEQYFEVINGDLLNKIKNIHDKELKETNNINNQQKVVKISEAYEQKFKDVDSKVLQPLIKKYFEAIEGGLLYKIKKVNTAIRLGQDYKTTIDESTSKRLSAIIMKIVDVYRKKPTANSEKINNKKQITFTNPMKKNAPKNKTQ